MADFSDVVVTAGVARQGFDLDLRYGVGREDALARVLTLSTVEVKSDRKCELTGNVFVEYRYRGRPSGIAATTASHWAIEVVADVFVLLPTAYLKRLCRLALAAGMRKPGGDFNNAHGALVPVAWLVDRRQVDRAIAVRARSLVVRAREQAAHIDFAAAA